MGEHNTSTSRLRGYSHWSKINAWNVPDVQFCGLICWEIQQSPGSHAHESQWACDITIVNSDPSCKKRKEKSGGESGRADMGVKAQSTGAIRVLGDRIRVLLCTSLPSQCIALNETKFWGQYYELLVSLVQWNIVENPNVEMCKGFFPLVWFPLVIPFSWWWYSITTHAELLFWSKPSR